MKPSQDASWVLQQVHRTVLFAVVGLVVGACSSSATKDPPSDAHSAPLINTVPGGTSTDPAYCVVDECHSTLSWQRPDGRTPESKYLLMQPPAPWQYDDYLRSCQELATADSVTDGLPRHFLIVDDQGMPLAAGQCTPQGCIDEGVALCPR